MVSDVNETGKFFLVKLSVGFGNQKKLGCLKEIYRILLLGCVFVVCSFVLVLFVCLFCGVFVCVVVGFLFWFGFSVLFFSKQWHYT